MLPIFSRRSPPQGDAIIELLEPILCNQYRDSTWSPMVTPTTSRLVMPIKVQENRMYEIPIQFQCPCCREIWGGYFHYLSWELPDNWRMDPMSKAHLVISRDTDLCGRQCRTGDGTTGYVDKAIFCKCVGTARYLSKPYYMKRWNMGWVVDNPDIPDHTDATMRRYYRKTTPKTQ